jgi:hypothetical protein
MWCRLAAGITTIITITTTITGITIATDRRVTM